MNVLRNLRAFLLAYVSIAIITFLYILIKARTTINPFTGFEMSGLQGLLYQFALYYCFTLSPLIAAGALMTARAFTAFRGGVIAKAITLGAVAVIAAAYPIYIRYMFSASLTREFKAFDISTEKKLLPTGGLVSIDSGKIRIKERGAKDAKFDYRDVSYIQNGSPTVYHAAYGTQGTDRITLTWVTAYNPETGATRNLRELSVPYLDESRPDILTVNIVKGFLWAKDIPQRFTKKQKTVPKDDGSLSKIFARFNDNFYLFDIISGFPLILTMRDIFSAALRVIPYAQFVPVFSFAIFLLLLSVYHLMYSISVPRLSLHNMIFVLICWLVFMLALGGIGDAIGLRLHLRTTTQLTMLAGFAVALAAINLTALIFRYALQFSVYYRRAKAE